MNTLSNYILEHLDSIGNELSVGDNCLYKSTKITIIGEITDITKDDNPKYIIKTIGWEGEESKKSLLKDTYKVNVDSKNIFKVNLKKK